MPTEEHSSKNTLYCTFCGKSQHEVKKLIAGPSVFICNECVVLCLDIIIDEGFTQEDIDYFAHTLKPPVEIRDKVLEVLRNRVELGAPYITLKKAFDVFERATKPKEISTTYQPSVGESS